MSVRLARVDAVVAVLLAVVTLALWFSAPMNGDFSFSDAPRHALNGLFVKDLIAAFPWRDPAAYAMQYYVQYPALTILFYPPLFYLVSAPFYALFGGSEATALAVVLLHYFAFALGLYVLARRWLNPGLACAVALSSQAAPELALWGRQVMLEIPNLAYIVWAFVALRRYGETGRPAPLYAGAFLLLCALYTKLNAVFLLPVAALMIWVARGNVIWRDRHLWIVIALFVVGFIPLVVLTVQFGQMNVRQVVDQSLASAARPGTEGWLWYVTQFPRQLGWPLLIAACLWPVAVLLRRGRGKLDLADLVLVLGWLIAGYLFLSDIDLKSARYSTVIVPPMLVLAGLAIDRLIRGPAATAMAFGLVAITFLYTWLYVPVPAVAGYRTAAQQVAQIVPRDGVVLFSGLRDGSFIFNMRTITNRPDIYTIRADKLLLNLAVERSYGVEQKPLTEQQISEMLDRYGVSYVVAQDDFWTDLEVMAHLDAVLHSGQFVEIARIPVTANVPTEDKELRIYRNTHPVDAKREDLRLDLRIINRSVEGSVGRAR
jgi:4-amino-4-deoxy-L-arabinose transferase-like glycosyltransferase